MATQQVVRQSTKAVDVVASDWNNRIRETVMKVSSKIPEVGAVVAIVIGYFWPEDKIDVFTALKADVTKLVKKEILDYELNLHKSEIDALKIVMQRYKEAQKHEKGNYLSNWITEADKLSVIFRQSSNNIHLILLTITLALLHLTGLRERLDFGKELYDEDNTKQWKKDLEEAYRMYNLNFFPNIYKKWKAWRADQVKIAAWVETHEIVIPPFFRKESHATVEDTITGEKKHFSVDLHDSTQVFEGICEDHKTRMCNDANADMAGCIAATFEYLKLLPDNSKNFSRYDKGVFGRIFRGPYSEDLCYNERTFGMLRDVPIFRTRPNFDDYSATSGPLTKVVVREWNTIDAMQFIYAKRQGTMAGNASGGQRHDIDVTGKPINGLWMGFSNGVLTFVQIKYYDGTSSSTHGNRSGWKCSEVNAKGPPAYRVSSWSYKVDNGPSSTRGPSVVQLEYAPQVEC